MKILTNWRSDSQRDAVPTFLDEVHDVAMVERVDIHMVHRQDAITNLETSTTFSWRSYKLR